MLRELIDFNIEVISKRYHFENDYDIGKDCGYVDIWISDVDKLESSRFLLVVWKMWRLEGLFIGNVVFVDLKDG